MSTGETPVEEMSFEAAMKALEQVVDKLESGETPLDESIALYDRGARLRKRCEEVLQAAEAKVAQITQAPDGTVGAKPVSFD